MANFKVGQRVRIIHATGSKAKLVGCEATIMSPAEIQPDSMAGVLAHRILVDSHRCWTRDGCYHARPSCLAPVVDPRADQFVREVTKPNPAILNTPVTA